MSELPMGQIVRLLAEEAPDAPMLTEGALTLTRAQFERRTNCLAHAYAALGVKADDLVTIASPNGIAFFEACFANWKLGATPQPVSSHLPLRERQAIVDLAQPALIIGVDAADHPGHRTLPLAYEPASDVSDAPILPDRVARYWRAPTSGGSTGRPKIILSNVRSVADPDAMTLKLGAGGTVLVAGPLYHGSPFMMGMYGLCRRNHVVIMPRFDALDWLRLIERHRVTYTQLVPTMMARIWRLGEETRARFDLSSLKAMVHLGAACPIWLKQAWIDWLGPERIFEFYAGTETFGMTWITGKEWLAHKGSVGRPIRGCEMRVLDDKGEELPRGTVGEIFMRLTNSTEPSFRYIGAEAKSRAGWNTLGDLGSMDEDGYLYIADRRTDMIVSGGANIYPAEVEAALDEHPQVISSAVIGLPDDDLGARVHAIYHAAAPIPEGALRAHLASRLVRYKIPRSFEFSAAPLRDEGGKMRRSALREARIN